MSYKIGLAEILENAAKKESLEEKVDYLKHNANEPLLMILKGIFDPRITWLLPEGDAPYKPTELFDQEGTLYREVRRLTIFGAINGTPMNPDIPLNKKGMAQREALFIQLLTMITPKDAELLIAMKDKKLPKFCRSTKEKVGLTKYIIEQAFSESELFTGPRDKDFDPKEAQKELIQKAHAPETAVVVNSTTYAAGLTIKPAVIEPIGDGDVEKL